MKRRSGKYLCGFVTNLIRTVVRFYIKPVSCRVVKSCQKSLRLENCWRPRKNTSTRRTQLKLKPRHLDPAEFLPLPMWRSGKNCSLKFLILIVIWIVTKLDHLLLYHTLNPAKIIRPQVILLADKPTKAKTQACRVDDDRGGSKGNRGPHPQWNPPPPKKKFKIRPPLAKILLTNEFACVYVFIIWYKRLHIIINQSSIGLFRNGSQVAK